MVEKVKCLIIGSGPAGYTAGIYTSRADLQPVLIEGLHPGGQLTITTEVENFPGYPEGESGPGIMEDIRKQAMRFGADIRTGMVTKVDFSQYPFLCEVDDHKKILAETVIIATGAIAKWLGIESENHFRGFGVSTCATCDGFFYKGKDVVVVGGGDTALEDAMHLAKMCRKVYLIHRRDEFRGSKVMQNKVFATPNIEIKWNSVVREIKGERDGFMRRITGVSICDTTSDVETLLPVEGVFVAVGHIPVTELFKGQIDLDDYGYIKTKPGTMETNIPGVFAAGDVQDSVYRQAITAAASGCMAAIEAERFLQERGN